MQGYGNGIGAYRQTQVTTADPRRLVIMCYENVIKQLGRARSAYESGDFEAKGKALGNTYDTIELLLQSLDLKQGGDIARALQSLYTYSLRRLPEGDLNKDIGAFSEMARLFEEMLASWKELSLQPGVPEGTTGRAGAREPTAMASGGV